MDVKPIRDFGEYVGKQMEFKVVKINQEFKNVVVSYKAFIEAELKGKRLIIQGLEVGQVLEGTVKNITSYGVFVDLGGVNGLVHITDMSYGRVGHPEEMVEVDQKINVVILGFDDNKKRIALGMKQLTRTHGMRWARTWWKAPRSRVAWSSWRTTVRSWKSPQVWRDCSTSAKSLGHSTCAAPRLLESQRRDRMRVVGH